MRSGEKLTTSDTSSKAVFIDHVIDMMQENPSIIKDIAVENPKLYQKVLKVLLNRNIKYPNSEIYSSSVNNDDKIDISTKELFQKEASRPILQAPIPFHSKYNYTSDYNSTSSELSESLTQLYDDEQSDSQFGRSFLRNYNDLIDNRSLRERNANTSNGSKKRLYSKYKDNPNYRVQTWDNLTADSTRDLADSTRDLADSTRDLADLTDFKHKISPRHHQLPVQYEQKINKYFNRNVERNKSQNIKYNNENPELYKNKATMINDSITQRPKLKKSFSDIPKSCKNSKFSSIYENNSTNRYQTELMTSDESLDHYSSISPCINNKISQKYETKSCFDEVMKILDTKSSSNKLNIINDSNDDILQYNNLLDISSTKSSPKYYNQPLASEKKYKFKNSPKFNRFEEPHKYNSTLQDKSSVVNYNERVPVFCSPPELRVIGSDSSNHEEFYTSKLRKSSFYKSTINSPREIFNDSSNGSYETDLEDIPERQNLDCNKLVSNYDSIDIYNVHKDRILSKHTSEEPKKFNQVDTKPIIRNIYDNVNNLHTKGVSTNVFSNSSGNTLGTTNEKTNEIENQPSDCFNNPRIFYTILKNDVISRQADNQLENRFFMDNENRIITSQVDSSCNNVEEFPLPSDKDWEPDTGESVIWSPENIICKTVEPAKVEDLAKQNPTPKTVQKNLNKNVYSDNKYTNIDILEKTAKINKIDISIDKPTIYKSQSRSYSLQPNGNQTIYQKYGTVSKNLAIIKNDSKVPMKTHYNTKIDSLARPLSLQPRSHISKFSRKYDDDFIISSALRNPFIATHSVQSTPKIEDMGEKILSSLGLDITKSKLQVSREPSEGGCNLGLWKGYINWVSGTSTKNAIIYLKLVSAKRKSRHLPTEAENCRSIVSRKPEIRNDSLLKFPMVIINIFLSKEHKYDLFVLPLAKGTIVSSCIISLSRANRQNDWRNMFTAIGMVLAHLHKKYGMSHTDFQTSNIFYDEQTKTAQIIDLGGLGQKTRDTDSKHFSSCMKLFEGILGKSKIKEAVSIFESSYKKNSWLSA